MNTEERRAYHRMWHQKPENRARRVAVQKVRRDAMRARFVEYKKTRVCERCGFSDYRAIQFHHLGNKDRDIASMMTYSWEKILAEIAKCEALCANCHSIEHWDD